MYLVSYRPYNMINFFDPSAKMEMHLWRRTDHKSRPPIAQKTNKEKRKSKSAYFTILPIDLDRR